MYGPKKPERLPMELIAAMPAAADAPVRKLLGMGQNNGGTAETPICPRHSSIQDQHRRTDHAGTGHADRGQRQCKGHVLAALERTVGVAAERDHADGAEDEGQGRQEACLQVRHARAP